MVEENLHFAIVLEFKKAHSKVMRSVASVNIKTDFKWEETIFLKNNKLSNTTKTLKKTQYNEKPYSK